MKRPALSVLAASASALLVASLATTSADAQPRTTQPPASPSSTHDDGKPRSDNRPGPLTAEQNALKRAAMERLARNPQALRQKREGATIKLGKGKYVEFPRERDDRILTMLAEFGEQSDPDLGDAPGPLHNEIPEPDRSVDNSTLWVPDFNLAHFEEMFNGDSESMKHYYERLSSNRYSVTNDVHDWVKVPNNASFYGDNAVEDHGGSWQFIADTADAWYQARVDEGMSPAEIDEELASHDVWDRYDFDGDGNFNEADGYIDHFQAVHAGEGEEAGADPDMIWSHRWYAFGDQFGQVGPNVDGVDNLMGGTEIGDSGYFIGDYTVEPENGGVGVFAHEFGHDLGLPDFYDTAGGDNGTAFWTLMSSGSWLGHGDDPAEGIGTLPGLMGPEEKLFLGWLDYTEVDAGQRKNLWLNPAQVTTKHGDQAVKVNLPDKRVETYHTDPVSGEYAWWSGSEDGLNNTLAHEVPAAQEVTVSTRLWHDIEADYDFLYAEYSTDGGTTWDRVGDPISGASDGWTTHEVTYQAGGQASMFRFRYQTDGGVHNPGAYLDDISISADGTTVLTDDVEAGEGEWDVRGWTRSTGTQVTVSPRFYLAENRQYLGYDKLLQEGPYNFSEAYTRPNWVEFFPYQDGMLVWYVDYSQEDNNTSQHPGTGRALPVDARPAPFVFPDGTQPGNRRQPFDATFGLEQTDRVCLHKQVQEGDEVSTLEACAPSSPGIAEFNDSEPDRYWSAANPLSSTKVAGVGVSIRVVKSKKGDLRVRVTNPAR